MALDDFFATSNVFTTENAYYQVQRGDAVAMSDKWARAPPSVVNGWNLHPVYKLDGDHALARLWTHAVLPDESTVATSAVKADYTIVQAHHLVEFVDAANTFVASGAVPCGQLSYDSGLWFQAFFKIHVAVDDIWQHLFIDQKCALTESFALPKASWLELL